MKTITAQVNAELRPGAGQSRARAELAAARTQFVQAQEAIEISRAALAQLTGTEPSEAFALPADLSQLPPENTPSAANIAGNPAVIEQNAVLDKYGATTRARAVLFSQVDRWPLNASVEP